MVNPVMTLRTLSALNTLIAETKMVAIKIIIIIIIITIIIIIVIIIIIASVLRRSAWVLNNLFSVSSLSFFDMDIVTLI